MFFKSKSRVGEDGGERPNETGLPKWAENSPLLRQLFFEKWFRYAFIVAVLGLIAFPPLLLMRWKASPPHIVPSMGVRGLDRLQSMSMRRTARKHAAAGRYREATTAWRLAMSANPVDTENMREFLRYVPTAENPEYSVQPLAMRISSWLMDVTLTNRTDFEAVANVYGHFEEYELVVRLLSMATNELSAMEAERLLEAQFHRGEMESFRDIWVRHPALTNSSHARLYRTAWECGWGPSVGQSEARLVLAAAKKDPALSRLAHRLQLPVAVIQNQPEVYATSLRELEKVRADRYSDHVNHWILLSRSGKNEEAIRLAKQFNGTPSRARDCEVMASALSAFGLDDDALKFLERQRKEFPNYVVLWMQSAQILIRLERWEELNSLGMALRNSKHLRSQAQGYAYYLEALASLRMNRKNQADEAIRQAVESPIQIPFLGYAVATGMSRMGYPDPALRLLDRLESTYGKKADYWFQMQIAAYEAKDADGMLAAAEKAFALAPNHRVTINNLAAALLILRQRPSEALRLTLRKYTETPHDEGSILNHAMALVQNQRDTEAEALLAKLNPRNLTDQLRTVWSFIRFEIDIRAGRAEEARKAASAIEAKFLMPPQQKWLDDELKRIGGKLPK